MDKAKIRFVGSVSSGKGVLNIEAVLLTGLSKGQYVQFGTNSNNDVMFRINNNKNDLHRYKIGEEYGGKVSFQCSELLNILGIGKWEKKEYCIEKIDNETFKILRNDN